MAVPRSRLAFGAEWETACAPCPKIKNKHKTVLSQIEESHQHPEKGWAGPKDPHPFCAALLGSKGGDWCCPTPGAIPWVSWVGSEDRNGILQVRWHSSGKNLSLSLGTRLHLVKLLLVFASPGPVPNFAARHTWRCNVGMTDQDQRQLQVAVSGCA